MWAVATGPRSCHACWGLKMRSRDPFAAFQNSSDRATLWALRPRVVPHPAFQRTLPTPFPQQKKFASQPVASSRLLDVPCIQHHGQQITVTEKHIGDLELGHARGLLDLDRGGILPARGEEEVLDLLDLLGL
jgi:hypothetical protein